MFTVQSSRVEYAWIMLARLLPVSAYFTIRITILSSVQDTQTRRLAKCRS